MFFRPISAKLEKLIPEPKDVYEALEPLHVICQLIGLAPYKTVQNQESGIKTYQCSVWTIARCVFLFILYATVITVHILMLDSIFGHGMQEHMPRLQDYFIALITLVAVGFACIFAGKIVEVFKKIDAIDKEFQGLAVWMPYRRTFVTVILNMVFIVILGACVLTWVLISHPLETLGRVGTVELAIYLPFLLLGYLMESQYVHYLNLLRHRYSILNEYLEALARENKTYNGWVADDKEDNTQVDKINKNILKSVEIISDSIVVIEKVASLHIKVSDTAMLINTAFSVQLLFRITIAFISIVTALYMIGVNFSNPNAESNSVDVNLIFTAWAGSSALELMTVVWVTNAATEEIEMYSLQMYHNRLQFYICGLFPLDYTLLHTIVAGVTTYLVILIQFNSASTGSNNSTANAKKS